MHSLELINWPGVYYVPLTDPNARRVDERWLKSLSPSVSFDKIRKHLQSILNSATHPFGDCVQHYVKAFSSVYMTPASEQQVCYGPMQAFNKMVARVKAYVGALQGTRAVRATSSYAADCMAGVIAESLHSAVINTFVYLRASYWRDECLEVIQDCVLAQLYPSVFYLYAKRVRIPVMISKT